MNESAWDINPVLYNLHHMNEIEDIPFWIAMAEQVGGPILELGCGTGRLLIPLAIKGFSVLGLDNNLPMLSFCRRQIPQELLNRIGIFQADIQEFHLEKKFSFIIFACNTYSTLTEYARKRAISRIVDHLNEEGVITISMPNPHQLAALPVYGEPEIETLVIHPTTGNPIQISSEWRRKEQIVEFLWHYDHMLPDGQVSRQTIKSRQNLLMPEVYQAELVGANLEIINQFGDFDRSNFHDESPSLIFVARKLEKFL